MVKEADLRDFGEFGKATGEIKVAFAWFEAAGWMVVCNIKTIVDPIECLLYRGLTLRCRHLRHFSCLFINQLRYVLLRHSGPFHGVKRIFYLQSQTGDHLYIRITKKFTSTKQAMPEVRLDHYFCHERLPP